MKSHLTLILSVALMTLPLLFGCQKATLIEDDNYDAQDGRSYDETETEDTITVSPDITTEGWDSPIDVNFEFGGNE